jgi:hypothetical protein
MTSSTFLVNRELGRRILHWRGVRQGDPLSPLPSILAMEPLHRLIKKAQQMGLLTSLSKGSDELRISMYVDDDALFIAPSEDDFRTIKEVLKIFAATSGLQVNVAKTEIYPIRCDAANLSYLTSSGMILSTFSCKYLGLPLHYKKPSKQMMLPGWKKKFLTCIGRGLLMKNVLAAMPTFFLSDHKMHKWPYARFDRYRRSFLLKGSDPNRVRGGHSLINWKTYLLLGKWGMGFGI